MFFDPTLLIRRSDAAWAFRGACDMVNIQGVPKWVKNYRIDRITLKITAMGFFFFSKSLSKKAFVTLCMYRVVFQKLSRTIAFVPGSRDVLISFFTTPNNSLMPQHLYCLALAFEVK